MSAFHKDTPLGFVELKRTVSAADDRATLSVCEWTKNDDFIVCAQQRPGAGGNTANTLLVWSSSTRVQIHELRGHSGNIVVLRSSPVHDHVVMSGGHDGFVIVWDLMRGSALKLFNIQFQPTSEPVSVPLDCLDCQFSPDGAYIAATDVWGHLSLFGIEELPAAAIGPSQQFFHCDFDPIVRHVV